MTESVAVAKEADAKKGVSPTRSDNSIHRVRNEPERQLGSLRDVIGNIRRDGGTPSAESIAAELSGVHATQRAPALLALQHTHGNRYVQRVVSGIQAKLVVGQPGDIYEQEADRVAADVVRHISVPQSQDVQIFRFPEERERRLTRSPITEKKPITAVQQPSYGVGASIPPRIGEVMRGAREGGQNLPGSMREPLEHAIGADFRGVRVHVDAESDQVNRLLHARAFTTGQDIFFRRGEYQPRSRQGQELLAHELVHVLQQSGAGPQTEFVQLSPAEDFESALYLETEDARVLALLSAIRRFQLADLQEALDTYYDLAYLFQLGLSIEAQEMVLCALCERITPVLTETPSQEVVEERAATLPTETPSQEVVEERAASHVREAFQQYIRAREQERQEQVQRELMEYLMGGREYPPGEEPTETLENESSYAFQAAEAEEREIIAEETRREERERIIQEQLSREILSLETPQRFRWEAELWASCPMFPEAPSTALRQEKIADLCVDWNGVWVENENENELRFYNAHPNIVVHEPRLGLTAEAETNRVHETPWSEISFRFYVGGMGVTHTRGSGSSISGTAGTAGSLTTGVGLTSGTTVTYGTTGPGTRTYLGRVFRLNERGYQTISEDNISERFAIRDAEGHIAFVYFELRNEIGPHLETRRSGQTGAPEVRSPTSPRLEEMQRILPTLFEPLEEGLNII